jgi:hypothetical protein
MHNKHIDELDHDQEHDTGCIADLCPLLGCRLKYSRGGSGSGSSSGSKAAFKGQVDCTTSDLERAKFRCENLMRKCFLADPSSGEGMATLTTFRDSICGSLQCVNGQLTSLVDTQMRYDARGPQVALLTVLSWVVTGMLVVALLCYVFFWDRKKPLVAANVHRGVRVALKRSKQY